MNGIKVLPRPRQIDFAGGDYVVPTAPVLRLSGPAAGLGLLVEREWRQEQDRSLAIQIMGEGGWSFAMGATPVVPADLPAHCEGYVLEVAAVGLRATASSRDGLLHAWQTLKQLFRQDRSRIPALRIRDWPDLDWRVYHIDLKGTRRTLENLHSILPQLAEFKINAVLVEYENDITLDRHPDLALPEALGKTEIRDWVEAARDYGITVIPLVQTLGHLQYVLDKPAYRHLQEKEGDPAEACVSNPDTWALIRDFMNEMLELHPGMPFIHVGLDETFHVGTCPRCVAALAGRPRATLYVEWVNRVCRYLVEKGVTPLVWGDVIASELDPALMAQLNRDAVYVDWGYTETGPLFPFLSQFKHGRFSREWLQRPEGEIAELPALGFGGRSRLLEDLPQADQDAARNMAANPEYPRKFKTWTSLAGMAQASLKCGAVSGIRVSFHGCMTPRFITAQLNTISAAEACRQNGARLLIGSSWSRGQSFAGVNAPPELDWYGIATLGEAGWGTLSQGELRAFDERFAFQFFGLEDGHIGDLFYLVERTTSRVDHVMDNYLPYVVTECAKMRSAVLRNLDRFDLFAGVVDLQILRQRAQFSLLEMEYFYATWSRVPTAFKGRMLGDIRAVKQDLEVGRERMHGVYAQTMPEADAKELVATQLDFARDSMVTLARNVFGCEV